jgi:BRCT domain type II-containing protein
MDFLFTGTLDSMEREEAEALVKRLGACGFSPSSALPSSSFL